MKRLVLYITIALLSNFLFGQQQGLSTQYMFNALAVNPAYAGTHETLSLTADIRSQWTGIDGAPNTQTISVHGPLAKDRIAVGLNVMHDKIGVTNFTSITPSGAYRIHFDADKVLSLGLSFSVSHYKASLTSLNPGSTNDVTFASDVNKWMPNLGAGAFFYTDKYYIGLSVPYLIKNDVATDNSNDISQANLDPHYYLTGGYVFKLDDKLKLKPNFMLRGVKGNPANLDLNTNLLIDDMFGVGLSYRWSESVALILELFLTEQLRFGYSYDYVVGGLNKVTTGSHEIMINYRFAYTKTKVVTPRYF